MIWPFTPAVPSNSSFPGLLVEFDMDPLALSFWCPSGMEIMEAQCEEDGKWSPDPGSHVCMSDGNQGT